MQVTLKLYMHIQLYDRFSTVGAFACEENFHA